jgi:predicted acylesterase/phospholipase RssA
MTVIERLHSRLAIILAYARRLASRSLVSFHRRWERLFRPPWLFVTLAIYLVVLSALWQLDWYGGLQVGSAAGFTLLACAFPKLGMGIAVFWLLGWLYEFAGSPNPWRDCALLIASFAVAAAAILGLRRARARHLSRPMGWWPTDGEFLLILLLFLGTGWVFLSAADRLSEVRLNESLSSSRNESRPRPAQVKVGLALSGGGYRAALLHAGVLSALEELRVPTEVISSVSGASIIGAFYARGGTPQQFVDLVVSGSFDLEREVLRLNNVLCLISIPMGGTSFQLLPLSPKCSRTQLQANLLRRVLFGDVLAKEGSVEGRPELMLGTTDLAGTRMLGITPHGFVNIYLDPPLDRLSFANPAMLGGEKNQTIFFPTPLAHLPDQQPLADLVAASGAFPGALPAYRLSAPYTPAGSGSDRILYLLADGGLSDNSGIVLLDAAQLLSEQAKDYTANPFPPQNTNPPTSWNISRWDVDLILASDGSALTPNSVPGGAFDEFVRAMDVMDATTGGAEMFAARDENKHPRPSILLLSPRTFSRESVGGLVAALQFGTPNGWQIEKDLGYDLPPIGFASIDEETLTFIIAHMEPQLQNEAGAILADLVRSGAMTSDGLTVQAAFKRDGELGADPGSALARFYDLVQIELDRRLQAFVRTPTLRDRIDRETATSIYILGQYLVRFNKRYIICFLSRFEQIKQVGESNATPKCNAVAGAVAAKIYK